MRLRRLEGPLPFLAKRSELRIRASVAPAGPLAVAAEDRAAPSPVALRGEDQPITEKGLVGDHVRRRATSLACISSRTLFARAAPIACFCLCLFSLDRRMHSATLNGQALPITSNVPLGLATKRKEPAPSSPRTAAVTSFRPSLCATTFMCIMQSSTPWLLLSGYRASAEHLLPAIPQRACEVGPIARLPRAPRHRMSETRRSESDWLPSRPEWR